MLWLDEDLVIVSLVDVIIGDLVVLSIFFILIGFGSDPRGTFLGYAKSYLKISWLVLFNSLLVSYDLVMCFVGLWLFSLGQQLQG